MTKKNRTIRNFTEPKTYSRPKIDLTPEERIRFLANTIIDKIIEEENIYQEKLKANPDAKRIYETCECKKCKVKKIRLAIEKGRLKCSLFRKKSRYYSTRTFYRLHR